MMRIFVLWLTGRDWWKPVAKPVSPNAGGSAHHFAIWSTPQAPPWEFMPSGHPDLKIHLNRAPNVLHRSLQCWCFGMVWQVSKSWAEQVKQEREVVKANQTGATDPLGGSGVPANGQADGCEAPGVGPLLGDHEPGTVPQD